MSYKLFIPGPIAVSEKTLRAMSQPMIGHRSTDFVALYNSIQPELQALCYTKDPVYLSTSSAWGVMEGSLRNVVKKKVLNCMNGAFSDKWYDVALRCGKQATALKFEWGQPVDPEAVVRARAARENLRRLSADYWWVVALGAIFTLARFSEAFLVLRLQQDGLPLAFTPLVLIAMNLVYALGAYPLGKLSDGMDHGRLLAWGLVPLVAADALLAWSGQGPAAWLGVALWGLHMAATQGLLAAMVAHTAPADLRGTAYGMFNLVCGVAMLAASALAGLLWDQLGARATFSAGMVLALLALGGVLVLMARGALAPPRHHAPGTHPGGGAP